ncbi:hypothetical protein [Mucilaginibacter sp.]|jgi:hypothetical protein|uniref:hypothetical protein n=1 Tax=Mucilaginibacter sp. TaxID=1882438 RepID=UPI00356764E5
MTKLSKNKGYFLQGLIYFKTIGEFAFTISYTFAPHNGPPETLMEDLIRIANIGEDPLKDINDYS